MKLFSPTTSGVFSRTSAAVVAISAPLLAVLVGVRPALAFLPMVSLPLARQSTGSVWLPEAASSAAGETDFMFRALLILSGAVLLLLVGALDWMLWRYHRDETRPTGRETSVSRGLLAAAVALPLIAVLLVFLGGFRGFLDRSVAPARALQIEAQADEWHWTFHYPGDVSDAQLHLPLDRPVELVLRSPELIQGLYLPAFRAQQTAVPGQDASLWIEASRAGEYPLYGSQVLGAGEDSMRTVAIVHEAGAYEKWIATASNILELLPPIEAGKVLVERNGCLVCHTIDGTTKTGPSFKGVIGRHRVFTDGTKLVTDEAYVRESIHQPQKRVVEGFQPLMPSFEGKVSDPEIDAIIEYFKSLSIPQEGS